MAKKKEITDQLDEIQTVSLHEEVQDNITIKAPKDPLADKVKTLRNKGFDNNRIAAMLMISRTIIDKI